MGRCFTDRSIPCCGPHVLSDFYWHSQRFRGYWKQLQDGNLSPCILLPVVSSRDEADDCDGVGITSAAFNFVRDVSKRAESWLNFPLPFDDDNCRSNKSTAASAAVTNQYQYTVTELQG
ncbi:uncharacterized protein LOC131258359 [Magnolia sinica]|uniref:uncharacterized protein LOC131258359 n=1 Tax=Magnolia sinica TaxID=86752 RepID=UPI00265A118F|nr:uncharacterized protein LOC131258359 [Magnolia sinica]